MTGEQSTALEDEAAREAYWGWCVADERAVEGPETERAYIAGFKAAESADASLRAALLKAEAWLDADRAIRALHEHEALTAIPSDSEWAGRVADAWNAHDRAREAFAAALAGTPPVEGREGMVTVYDHEGRYLGCMGVNRWEALMASEAGTPPATTSEEAQ